jgi:hypothetical protein
MPPQSTAPINVPIAFNIIVSFLPPGDRTSNCALSLFKGQKGDCLPDIRFWEKGVATLREKGEAFSLEEAPQIAGLLHTRPVSLASPLVTANMQRMAKTKKAGVTTKIML